MAKTSTRIVKTADIAGIKIPFEINIKALLCKHNYRKHWSRLSGNYEKRCTRCGKVE